MSITEARETLHKSQRQVCEIASRDGVVIYQSALSQMESGKIPADREYKVWLNRQLLTKGQRIADMPTKLLAACIKERVEI
jgi:hypothetical protein